MRNPFVASDFFFKLTSYKKMQDNAIKVLHNQSLKVIEERKKELDSTKSSIADSDDIGKFSDNLLKL